MSIVVSSLFTIGNGRDLLPAPRNYAVTLDNGHDIETNARLCTRHSCRNGHCIDHHEHLTHLPEDFSSSVCTFNMLSVTVLYLIVLSLTASAWSDDGSTDLLTDINVIKRYWGQVGFHFLTLFTSDSCWPQS